jgi:lipopolysaccharide transport protein LptA
MSQQHASRFLLSRAKRAAPVIATVVLLGVGPLMAEEPVAISLASPTNSPCDGGAKEPTVITSERLEVDYARNIFTFKGNVLVVDQQMTLRADKMVVFLRAVTNTAVTATNAAVTSTNTMPAVQKIIATGSVFITQPRRSASCAHAEYTAEDGRVVLTENPKVESPDGTVTGEKITFWQGQDRMDVESGTHLILFPENMKPPAPDHTPAPMNGSTNAPSGIPSIP